MAPVSNICVKARVEQFPNDFYAKENILLHKFCLESVDNFRVDTIKDHKIKNSFDKKVFKKVISTETENNYNFVEI